MSDLKFQAPIEITVDVGITDGMNTGKVSVGCGVGKYPTESDIKEAIEKVGASKELPKGWRVMTKREWWKALCEEKWGTQVAMPGGDEWDA